MTTTLSSSRSGPEYGSSAKTSSAAPRDLAGAERLDERLLVHELATGGVDQLDPVLRRRELLPSDEPVRVLREREMERGEVGGREELGKRLDPVDAELGEALGAHVGIEGEDLHVQAAREPRHLPPDAAEADEAERLPGELVAGEPRAVPAALLERGVGLGNRAREAEQETERVLRCRDDGGLRRVRDDDSAPRGRVEIDVVDPHPGPADHLELRGLFDQAGVEVRAAADDDRVVVADPRGEVAVRVHIDVEPFAQEVDPGLGYGFANENSHVPRVSRAKEPASGAMDSAQHGQVPRAPDPAASGTPPPKPGFAGLSEAARDVRITRKRARIRLERRRDGRGALDVRPGLSIRGPRAPSSRRRRRCSRCARTARSSRVARPARR